jgi:signal transduction histidine kinase
MDVDVLAVALRKLSGQVLALEARNGELACEVKQLRAERHQMRSPATAQNNSHPVQVPRPAPALTALAGEDERRRLERDRHDGVQNELVALVVKLSLAEQDPDTPHALADTLSVLGARAQAALDSVREIARGMSPHCSPTSAAHERCARRRRGHR